jgi:hypothetical protein
MILAMVGFIPLLDRRLNMAIRSGTAAKVVPNPATKPMISSNDINYPSILNQATRAVIRPELTPGGSRADHLAGVSPHLGYPIQPHQ